MPIQSAAMKEYNRKQNVKGRILLFDFNKPQGDAIELKITGDNIKLNQFNPHGIDGVYDEKTGRLIGPFSKCICRLSCIVSCVQGLFSGMIWFC